MQEKNSSSAITDLLGNERIIDEEIYREAVFWLEDLEDNNVLNNYQIYNKAYENDRIIKCIEVLLNIVKEEPDTFKEGMLISNCLKNPLGMKFDQKNYNKTCCILMGTINKLKERGGDKKSILLLEEMLLYTYVLFHNNKINTSKLLNNNFSRYSLSEQLRMICIYIQDQTRMMRQKSHAKRGKRFFITGMENKVADLNVDQIPSQKISLMDNYEGVLENLNTLIHYLYATKKRELKNDNIEMHGDIHPFRIPAFQEIVYIAMQRRLYEMLEESFRYSRWKIRFIRNKTEKDIYYFEPRDKQKYKIHLSAGIRREYRLRGEIIKGLNTKKGRFAFEKIETLSNRIDLNNIESFHIQKEEFKEACEISKTIAVIYRMLLKEYYFTCEIQDFKVDDILKMYIFLVTYSQIYITAAEKIFKEDDYSCYKYLVPVVGTDYLVSEFSNIFEISKEKSEKILKCYIYDEKVRGNSEDIFSKPLLKINEKQVLLCASLIEQMNVERCVEKILQKYDIDLAPVGKEFENKLIEQLNDAPAVNVNTNKIEFMAYDGRSVEFDFIGTLDDYLLLFEFKSVLTPYDEVELKKREDVIKEGVDQLKRRCDIIKMDWDKIRNMANIYLPEEPYPDGKIIKLVCTNIFDFTTLKIDGIRITDESILLRYFTNPFINMYSLKKDSTEIVKSEFIWKNGKPTATEFLEYLDNPVALGNMLSCFKEEFKRIPAFRDDFLLGFIDTVLIKDPYREIINQKRQVIKGEKVGRNDPCPCGSGMKYKRCCGKE